MGGSIRWVGMTLAVAALATVNVDCAQPEPESAADTVSTEADRWLEGQIVLSGTDHAPMTLLERQGNAAVALTGELERELRRLQGARVRVGGQPGEAAMAPGGALEVETYTVVEIDGQRPYVGELIRTADGYTLAGADGNTLRLVGISDRLTEHEGARIWVIGQQDADALSIQSYGIIRP